MSLHIQTGPFEPSLARSNPPPGAARPRLHPFETILVAITAAHLSFLPWALGTMHGWSQSISLSLASAGFLVSALPRRENTDGAVILRWPVPRLFRSPIFWAGLVFLLYILVQAANPAWHFRKNEDAWWLEPLHPIAWLPSSIDAPFARSNPWRALVIFGSLLLVTSSVWMGFSRRKSYHALFALLAANATVLAIFGIIERLSGTDRIFGSYHSSNYLFVASFIYPNHAGAYFNLLVGLCTALAWWHYQRTHKQIAGPGPAVILALGTVFCSGLVIISYSRMSIALLVVFFGLTCSALILRFMQRQGDIRRRQEFIPVVFFLAAFVCTGLVPLGSETIRNRFSQFAANPTTAVEDRSLARRAARDMIAEHWLYGWGAGCFRYGFPKYTRPYPAIHYFPNGDRRSWEHAHNDILELLCEFGIVGALPLAFIVIRGGWLCWRKKVWDNLVSFALICACALTLLHSWVDFVFQSPAILLTWATLLVAALRWTTLDRPRQIQAGDEGS